MPELPEVETVRRGLSPVMENQTIDRLTVNRPNLRFDFPDRFQARLEGATIDRLYRRAKFLLADLSSGETLIMHLGMSGRFTITGKPQGDFYHQAGPDPKHDHVKFEMGNGAIITYNDPRRFGFMELWPGDRLDSYPRLQTLGPEHLSNQFSMPVLQTSLTGRQTPIKSALLDQKIIAGLGNIYVCEALFRAGISPRRMAKNVGPSKLSALAAAINDVIAEAIEAGGSSISDFTSAAGELGYFQKRFSVYDREGQACYQCDTPVRRIVQAGRSSFFCPACQR